MTAADSSVLTTVVAPRRSVYGHRNLAIVGAASAVLLVLAIRYFGRVEANFAEEL